MCYSSRVEADYRRYLRVAGGARLSYAAFMAAFQRRAAGAKIAFPRALGDSFLSGSSPEDQALGSLIREHREAEATGLQQKLFAQRVRLVEAERKLAARTTKTATESKRIALAKIEGYRKALAGEVAGGSARIYPFHYAPVATVLNGERVVLPMRYHLRPAGAPASFDEDYDGCYNSFRAYLTVSKGIHSENQRSRRTNVFRCLGRVSDHSKGAKPGQPLVGRKSRCRSGCQSLLLVLAR